VRLPVLHDGLSGRNMVGIVLRRHEQETESDEQRLLKLFRNRTALKKEFSKLRREGEQLQKQLQQQEGVTLHAQQQLEQLEGMLAHPAQAANTSVFYQLRGVWHHCRRKQARLAENLLAHQRDRELKLDLDKFNAVKKAALAVIEQHEQKARKQHEAAGVELESLRRQWLALRGFWNYFKRRTIAAQIENADEICQAAMTHLKQCLEQKRVKEAKSPPAFDGLSVAGRRKINLMLIAVAQELYLHFSKQNVSVLAREASVRQITDVNYGDITACREMNIFIEKCLRSLPSGKDLVASALQRVAYLERCAGYRLDTDTVPVAGSFAEIPLEFADDSDAREQRTSININVLADEYWELYSVLLT